MIMLCFVFLALGQIEKIPPQAVDGKINWVYDLSEGILRAREAKKPVFLVFRCER